jgi:hypothetical protein
MFKELDVVSLKHSTKTPGLSRGSQGTIVQVYKKGEAFEVEFLDGKGHMPVLITLTPKDVDLVWSINTHPEIPYSTLPATINKDEEKYWINKLFSKPDPTSAVTHPFAF